MPIMQMLSTVILLGPRRDGTVNNTKQDIKMLECFIFNPFRAKKDISCSEIQITLALKNSDVRQYQSQMHFKIITGDLICDIPEPPVGK